MTGHGFWQGFADSVQENAVDALVTSFATTAVSVAASNILKCFQCFKEGTLVETEDGLKPIEDIQVGDKVLAYDEETGEQTFKPVKQLFRNETKCWCTVIVKPEKGQEAFEIISTPGHKYYLPDNVEKRDFGKPLEHAGYVGLSEKWVSAEELKFGDKVLLFDGTYGIIQLVKLEQLETPETTYNFEVEDFHTYYVGEQSVLVHNANCGKPKMANRGNTGRTDANNLVEKLAMEQVKSDPLNGSEVLKKIALKDNRWAASDGWVKMQSVIRSGSHQTTIHFVYNQALNLVDDFKFVAFKTLL